MKGISQTTSHQHFRYKRNTVEILSTENAALFYTDRPYAKKADKKEDIETLITKIICSLKQNITKPIIVSLVWENGLYKDNSNRDRIHEGHTFLMYVHKTILHINEISGDKKYYNDKYKYWPKGSNANYKRIIDEVNAQLQALHLITDWVIDIPDKKIKKNAMANDEGACYIYTHSFVQKLLLPK